MCLSSCSGRRTEMARRTFTMVDVTEILQHWYAGRPKVEVARSLGVDAKTVRRYVAPAAAGRPKVEGGAQRGGGRKARPRVRGPGGGGRDGAGRPAGDRGAVAGSQC